MTSRKFVTQATPEGSDCVAASSTPEGIAMLTGMGWSHPLLGALPLGLVRALHSRLLKRAVLTDTRTVQCLLWGDASGSKLCLSGLRGPGSVAWPLPCSLSGISSVRSEAEQVTDALSNSAHTARNDI